MYFGEVTCTQLIFVKFVVNNSSSGFVFTAQRFAQLDRYSPRILKQPGSEKKSIFRSDIFRNFDRRIIMADGSDLISDGSYVEVDFDETIDDFVGNGHDRGRLDFDEIDRYRDPLLDGFFASDSEEDDDDFDGFHEQWVQDGFTTRMKRRFTMHPGASEQHPEEAQPMHYFDILWGQELWKHLVTETNRYAEQERTRNPPPPFAPKWTPVDVPTTVAVPSARYQCVPSVLLNTYLVQSDSAYDKQTTIKQM